MLFALLLLSPYFSLLYILFDVYRIKRAKPHHCFAVIFILAIIGVYWFPWGDSQSHFAMYYSDIVNKYYSEYLLASTYWFYDLVIAKIADYTGNYTWGYFFWLLIPLWLFYFAIKRNLVHKEMYIQLFIYFILFLGIREYLDINRSTSAYLLFVSCILFYKKNKLLSILCLIMSLLLHDSVRIFLLLIPIGYLINNFSNRTINILYVITAIFSFVIINYTFPLLADERNLSIYFGEGWEDNKGVDSGFMYILGMCNLLIFIIQFLLIQSNRHCIKKSLYILFLSSSFIVVCGFAMWVLRERFLLFSNIIAASIILINWDKFRGMLRVPKWQILQALNLIFLARIALNMMLLYSAHIIHNSATKDNMAEFRIVSHSFYMPTLFLFDIDSFGFSDEKYLQLYDRVNNSIEL
ncbi:MAG: EpsG family protein [Alistipes sp.]|nr:EpsG family protein [Alistipes sp.]